jgi:hypothetical protein
MIAQDRFDNPLSKIDPRADAVLESLYQGSTHAGLMPASPIRRIVREPEAWLVGALHAACAYWSHHPSLSQLLDVQDHRSSRLPARGAQSLTPWRDGPAHGYVLRDEQLTIVAIAGSDDAEDWTRVNSRCLLTRFRVGRIHEGIAEYADRCERQLRRIIDPIGDGALDAATLFVGHSLGAAAAAQMPARLADLLPGVKVSLGFGCPRFADREAARWLVECAHAYLQIWNVGDPIPHLPPGGLLDGYRHPPGVHRYIGAAGNIYRTRRAVWWDLAAAAVSHLISRRLPAIRQSHSAIEYLIRLALAMGIDVGETP